MNEEEDETDKIAQFYKNENDANMDKIYIYGLVYMFDIIMKIFVCN